MARSCVPHPIEEGVAAVERAVGRATGGLGCDQVFLAAGGRSNGPVELAVKLARDRARVVDIGKTRLDLPWNSYYEKELDVRFSRSYGPGRYDDSYELDGIDYPAGYVRWTERRNLQCFLDLIAGDQLEVASLVSGTFPIDEAPTAYARLEDGTLTGVGYLLEYPPAVPRRSTAGRSPRPPGPPSAEHAPAEVSVRVGFVGAGSYATSMLLPHLAEHAHGPTGVGRDHALAESPSTPATSSASSTPAPTPRRCSPTTRWTRCSSSPGTRVTPTWCAAPCGPGRRSSSRSRWR